ATFSNLSLTTAGTYQLLATDSGLTSAYSSSFSVTIGSTGAKLAIVQQPQLIRVDLTSSTWWGQNTVGNGYYPAISYNAPSTSAFPVTAGANKVLVLEVSGDYGTIDTAGPVTYGGLPMTLAVFAAQSPQSNSQRTFAEIYYLNLTGASLNGSSFAGQVLVSTSTAKDWIAQAMVLSNVDTSTLPTLGNNLAAGVQANSSSVTATVSASHTLGSLAVIGSSEFSSSSTTDTYTWTDTNSVTPTQAYQAAAMGFRTGTTSQVWGGAAYLSNLPAASSLGVTASAASYQSSNALAVAVFSALPATNTAGQNIAPALIVNVLDATGHIVTTDSSSVTIAINSGPAGATLGGTTTVAAVNGVATFNNLSLTTAGAYTLKATDGTLTLATSTSFTINSTVASKLAFVQQPTAVTAGQNIAPAVTVNVLDQYGNLVTTDNSNVMIALNSGSGTLSGTTTVAAVNGVATFSNLALTTTGVYTLVATDGTLTSTTSNSFTVNPATAVKLALLQQPTTTIAGQSIAPAVTVNVQDQYGNLVTTDNSIVTMALNSGPGTLAGTLTVVAVNGVATFSNLSLSTAGAYTLKATDGTLTLATTSSFTVNPGAPSAVTLAPASDTGLPGDNRTKLNNSTPGEALSFMVVGTTTGTTVRLYADGTLLGSAVAGGTTTMVTTDGTTALGEGTWSITATQTLGSGSPSTPSPALNVIIDSVVPTLNLPDAPSGLTGGPIALLNLQFSKAVYGLTLTNATLTRDGGPNLLTASQTPGSSDQILWTVSNLATLTALPGSYQFTVLPVGITDAAGNPLTIGSTANWVKNTLTGSGSADSITLQFTSSTTASITVNANAAYSLNLTPLGTLTIDGGGGSDSLAITGATPSSTLGLTLAGVMSFTTTPAMPIVTVTGAMTACGFTASTLTIADGGRLVLAAGANSAAVLGQVSIPGTGQFDLQDNYLRMTGSDLATMRGLLAAGSIYSSTAVPDTQGIGYLLGSQYNVLHAGNTLGLNPGDIILKNTYLGDTTLKGY
ncbi:MAG: hypothetical protein WCI73_11490, partial [Phycisphaerae bacterium]